MIYLSTKPKKKKTKYASAEHKKKEAEAQAIQDALYKKWNVKSTKKSSNKKEFVMNTAYRGKENKVNSIEFTGGQCSKKNDQVYSGNYIIGICQTHKSNAVPITNKEHATDIARMRR